MIELEKTYLAKYLPDLSRLKSMHLQDFYIPVTSSHPKLRIRKKGHEYEMTKKVMMDNNPEKHYEHTIPLSLSEFNGLVCVPSKSVEKTRYFYSYNKHTYEIDVFEKDLKGLVTVDVEFLHEKDIKRFTPPPFCLIDVSSETFIAGGMLCGKSYEDIITYLNKLNYRKII